MNEGRPVNELPQECEKRTAADAAVECELCHHKAANGHLYSFYYGKKTSSSILDFLLALRGLGDPPLITGRGTAWICRRCVTVRRWLSYGSLAALLVALALLLAFPRTGTQIDASILPVLILIFGAYFLLMPPRRENEMAERLSIRIKSKGLRRQGYTVFLTNAQFARLR